MQGPRLGNDYVFANMSLNGNMRTRIVWRSVKPKTSQENRCIKSPEGMVCSKCAEGSCAKSRPNAFRSFPQKPRMGRREGRALRSPEKHHDCRLSGNADPCCLSHLGNLFSGFSSFQLRVIQSTCTGTLSERESIPELAPNKSFGQAASKCTENWWGEKHPSSLCARTHTHTHSPTSLLFCIPDSLYIFGLISMHTAPCLARYNEGSSKAEGRRSVERVTLLQDPLI